MREITRAWFPGLMPPAFLGVALAAALFASAQAAAQDYPARGVGAWTVAASKGGRGCFVTRAYERTGGTTLLFGLDVDGSNHLSVLNRNWSIKPRDRLALDFRLSNGAYSKTSAVGMAADGMQGFVTNFDAKFVTRFAASEFLHIFRGKVPVEQLSLEGSGAAVKELQRCLDLLRPTPAAEGGGEARASRIPKDPFAPDPARRAKP